MTIYLIRHGQTTGDIENRYGGDYEDHLTAEGKKQAETLADKLKTKGIEIIFSSPRVRAVETAEILKKKLGCSVEILDDLRERNLYGLMSGLVKSEAKEKYPDQVELLKDYHNTLSGGEAYDSLVTRATAILKEIRQKNYKTVAVISHGKFIQAVFRELLKLGEIKLNDCGFTELESELPDHLRLISSDGIYLDIN